MIEVKGRILEIPTTEYDIGFEEDNLVEIRSFKITDKRLFSYEFELDVLFSDGNKNIISLAKKKRRNVCFLTWIIHKEHLQNSGILMVQLRTVSASDEKVWHSEQGSFFINSSIKAIEYFENIPNNPHINNNNNPHKTSFANLEGENPSYTKQETDTKITEATDKIVIPEVDLSDFYTKKQTRDTISEAIDDIDIPEADLTNYYNKQEAQALISDETKNKLDKIPVKELVLKGRVGTHFPTNNADLNTYHIVNPSLSAAITLPETQDNKLALIFFEINMGDTAYSITFSSLYEGSEGFAWRWIDNILPVYEPNTTYYIKFTSSNSRVSWLGEWSTNKPLLLSLSEPEADKTLINIGAKSIVNWLQGIINNLKWLFDNKADKKALETLETAVNTIFRNGIIDSGQFIDLSDFFSNNKNVQFYDKINTENVLSFYNTYKKCNITAVAFNTKSALILDNCFYGCAALTKVNFINTTKNATSANYLFYDCLELNEIVGLDFTNATSATYAFRNCKKISEIDLLATPKLTNISYTFHSCELLTSIVGLDTSNIEVLDGTFGSCKALKNMELNCMKVISANGTFSGCINLESLKLNNMKVSFSVENCKLNATALNILFNSLDTVINKTVNIKSNPGATSCDKSIAVQKGWNVIDE